eukprot:g3848.t1
MATAPVQVVGFGESMLRYAPLEKGPAGAGFGQPSCGASFLRSVGGDEQNVLICLAQLVREMKDVKASWVSVLPDGPLAKVITHCGEHAGVCNNHVVQVAGEAVGTFTVIPEERRVHYQRSHSAFWAMAPDLFNWDTILSDTAWIHATGITPLCGAGARANWVRHLEVAKAKGIP